MDSNYRGAPLRTTREGKKKYDTTYRAIYGTKVKIPPPGKEREELCRRVVSRLCERAPTDNELKIVESVLKALEEMEG